MKVLSLIVAKQILEVCKQFKGQESIEGVATALVLMTREAGGNVQHAHQLVDVASKAVSLPNKQMTSTPPPREGSSSLS